MPAATALPGLLPTELLRRRPDVRSAERALAAQTAKIGVAQADYFPALSLNGTFALAATDGGELFSSAAQDFTVGPSLTWAIFNAGKIRNHVRAEEASTRAALAAYEQTVLAAYQECENALAAYVNETQRLESLRAAATAAAQSVELVNELYAADSRISRTCWTCSGSCRPTRTRWRSRAGSRPRISWRSTRRSAAAGRGKPRAERARRSGFRADGANGSAGMKHMMKNATGRVIGGALLRRAWRPSFSSR